jgi:hypothetical protein
MAFVREERVSFSLLAKAGRNSSEPPGYHAMFFSYFDDSSDQRRERYFACGGLIGGEVQWDTLDVLWNAATPWLKEPFRSTECECNQGQFKECPKAVCNTLMDTLVSILHRCKLSAFASIVPIADYREVFPGCARYDPYYLAVRHTILNMAHIGWMGRHHVKLWFEDNPATTPTTLRIYNELKNAKNWEPATYLLGITFGSKSLYPLQAADLVAREAFKHVDNLGARPTRIPMKRLGGRSVFALWKKDALTYLRDNGGPANIELLTSSRKTKPPRMPYFYKNF